MDTVFAHEEQADQVMPEEPAEDELMMQPTQVLCESSPNRSSKKSRLIGGLAVNISSRAIMVMAVLRSALPLGPVYGTMSGELLDPDGRLQAERESESSWRSSTYSSG